MLRQSRSLRLQSRLHSRHLLVDRQNVWHWSNRRNAVRVDLFMALGVVLLDMRELGRAAERRIVPIAVAEPSGRPLSVLHTATGGQLGSKLTYAAQDSRF